MPSLPRALALSLLLATAAPLAAPAMAQSAPDAARAFDATTLSLSASGETRVAPDKASITLGVQTTAPSASQAMRDNAARMTLVLAALHRAGLADKDLHTANISLEAQYDYQPNQPQRLTGYQASNELMVKVDDLPRLGAVLDAVVAAGANQVSAISFGLKDPQAAEDAARRAAVAALRAKAELYAQATGYRITRLVQLSEAGGYAPPQPMVFRAMAKSADATPVSAGQLDVRIDVSGVYELGR